MKWKIFSHLIVLTTLLAGCALPPQTGQAENIYPEPAYSREELAQLLAPVALYPDALLSQVLMAATYPIEVVEADRWLRRHPYLQGEALDRALAGQDWAPSVKSLCHFPSILALMSERIGETTDLGNAFLAQEYEVMDMIQELRAAAYAQGHLYTTAQQRIIFDGNTIIIVPATPILYVPYYDPHIVYGPWWYPDYPPYRWAPRGVTIGFGISYWPGIHFNFAFVSWSRFDWHRRHIHIDVHQRPRYVRHDHWVAKARWRHAPGHRRGAAYGGKSTVLKNGRPSRSAPSRSEARNAPHHRDQNRHVANPPPQSDRRPKVTPGRNPRPGVENPQNSPTKHPEPRPAFNRRPTDEHPGRTVWKKPEPQNQPKRNVRPGKQSDNSLRDKTGRSNATRPYRPQPVAKVPSRPEKQPEKSHGHRSVLNDAAKRYPTQKVEKERGRPERQPVAAGPSKRQGTPITTPPSQEERGKRLSNRANPGGRSETGNKPPPSTAKDRAEKPDRQNDSDQEEQRGRAKGNNRFERERE